MKRKALTITAAAAAIALAAAAYAAPSIAHGPDGGFYQGGPGMMGHMGYGMGGPGMMGHMGYGMGGPGMMGRGMGAGMMGYGPGAFGDCPMLQAASGREVTVDSVSAVLEHRLTMWGNERLKLGEVTEQGEDAIVGEIVTKDGSLVERLVFDRHTGRLLRSE